MKKGAFFSLLPSRTFQSGIQNRIPTRALSPWAETHCMDQKPAV